MVRPRTIALVLVLLIQILGTAHAIGISPSGKEIPYLPGEESKVIFTAINNGNEVAIFDVYAEGELASHTTIEKRKLTLAPQSAKKFSVILKIPKGLYPGTHSVQIGITESGNPKSGTVSGRAGVVASIEFFVPFFGKFMTAKLRASNVNIGEPADFALEVRNLGNETIKSIGSTITIFGEGEKNGFADMKPIINLGPLARAATTAQWLPNKGGSFEAIADVIYDGLATQAKTSFKVGSFVVDIVDVIYNAVFAGEIGKIQVKLESRWNSKLENVFTEVFIYQDGIILSDTKGKPFSIDPWGAYTDLIYIDTDGIEPGAYDGKAVVHYSGETAEQAFRLALKSRKQFDATIYVTIIILAISAFALSIAYSRRGRRKYDR